MDEHDPEFDPEFYAPPQESWWDFFMALGRAGLLALFVGMLVILLGGCDSAELDRLQAAAEHRDRFYRGCMPRKGDTVTAQWVSGELICKRITPTGRYGRSFPHAEVKIATIED